MNAREYLNTIEALEIRPYGFDTHARALDISKEDAKTFWNDATDYEFKRSPRTEYTLKYRPELSNRIRPYWELQLPEGHKYMAFFLTETTPILIPNGFITDKGSIPFIFRNIIPHDDREMILAFLVHDLECETKRMMRFTVDGLLYEVGTEMEAGWIKKNIIYSAVRAAAWRSTPDRVVRGFNISKFNRELIAETERQYLVNKHTEHLDFLTEMRISHAKI